MPRIQDAPGADHRDPERVDRSYVGWKGWSDDEFGTYAPLEGSFFDAEIAPLLPTGAAKPRVLEFGFGNGAFLGWCRDRELECYGVEIDATVRERARRRGVGAAETVMEEPIVGMAGTFDLIAAFDVIEHIEQAQLATLFGRFEGLLKPGGFFVARFPNGDSPFGRVNQHGDVTHTTTLGRGKIDYLARVSGLSIVSIADPKRPWRDVGLSTAVRRLVGGVARHVIESCIRTLYFGGEPINFDRNTVAVLQKPKSVR